MFCKKSAFFTACNLQAFFILNNGCKKNLRKQTLRLAICCFIRSSPASSALQITPRHPSRASFHSACFCWRKKKSAEANLTACQLLLYSFQPGFICTADYAAASFARFISFRLFLLAQKKICGSKPYGLPSAALAKDGGSRRT